jgi:hypothetical protein
MLRDENEAITRVLVKKGFIRVENNASNDTSLDTFGNDEEIGRDCISPNEVMNIRGVKVIDTTNVQETDLQIVDDNQTMFMLGV